MHKTVNKRIEILRLLKKFHIYKNKNENSYLPSNKIINSESQVTDRPFPESLRVRKPQGLR